MPLDVTRFDEHHQKFGAPPSIVELPDIAELSLNLRDTGLSFETPRVSSLGTSIGGEAIEPATVTPNTTPLALVRLSV